jgi:hypothetical protein
MESDMNKTFIIFLVCGISFSLAGSKRGPFTIEVREKANERVKERQRETSKEREIRVAEQLKKAPPTYDKLSEVQRRFQALVQDYNKYVGQLSQMIAPRVPRNVTYSMAEEPRINVGMLPHEYAAPFEDFRKEAEALMRQSMGTAQGGYLISNPMVLKIEKFLSNIDEGKKYNSHTM